MVVILGPSGSGKTTFLRCLNALEMPEQGTLEFSGNAPLKIDFAVKQSKRDFSATPQIRYGVPKLQPVPA